MSFRVVRPGVRGRGRFDLRCLDHCVRRSLCWLGAAARPEQASARRRHCGGLRLRLAGFHRSTEGITPPLRRPLPLSRPLSASTATAIAAVPVAVAIAASRAFSGRGRFGRSGGLAFEDRLGQPAQEQLDRTHAVVIARDRQVDHVGIAVGVQERDDLDAQLPGLGHRDMLAARVDDQQGLGQSGHMADAGEVALDLSTLAGQGRDHLLRVAQRLLAVQNGFELLEPLQAGCGWSGNWSASRPASARSRRAYPSGRTAR